MTTKHQRRSKTSQANMGAVQREEARVEDLVRQRAYEIYLARESRPGDALGDWLQAEREIISDASANTDEAQNG